MNNNKSASKVVNGPPPTLLHKGGLKRKIQKTVPLLISVLIILSAFGGMAAAEPTVIASGSVSDLINTGGSAPWRIESDGTDVILYIGAGTVFRTAAFQSQSPWFTYRTSVTKIVFEGDVYAGADVRSLFREFSSVTSIEHSERFHVTDATTDIGAIFLGMSNVSFVDVSHWDVSNVTMMDGVFWDMANLTTLDVSSWDTSSATGMSSLFDGTSRLTLLDIGHFQTGNVTWMNTLFRGTGAPTLDVSNWDTSNVTTMSQMFFVNTHPTAGDPLATRFTNLDVSNWDVSNVTDFSNMFSGQSNLTSLDLSGWDTQSATTMLGMFNNATRLRELHLGKDFHFHLGNAGLMAVPGNATLSNNSQWLAAWQYIGTGTVERPNGTIFTSAQLMSQYDGATHEGIWVWRPRIYEITFNPNSGTGTMTPGAPRHPDFNENYALPPNAFTRDNYEFTGWNTAAGGTGTAYSNEHVFTPWTLRNNMTLYAQWQLNVVEYNLTYNLNGGTGGPTPNPVTGLSAGTHTLSTTAPTRGQASWNGNMTNVVFVGWSSTLDTHIYSASDTLPTGLIITTAAITTADVTVYAVWGWDTNGNGTPDILETKYNLTYNLNNGAGGPTPNPVTNLVANTYTLSTTAPTHAQATLDGNLTDVVFVGWGSTLDTHIYSASDTLPTGLIITTAAITNADVTVYAVWGWDTNGNGTPDILETKYNLTYNLNNGAGGPTPNPVTNLVANTYTLSTTAPTHAQATLDGNLTDVVFVGWSGTLDTHIYSASDTLPTGLLITSIAITTVDVTVYAVWGWDTSGNGKPDVLEDKYTITYTSNNADSGTVPSDPNYYISGASATVLDNIGNLQRTGFTFGGWNDGSTTHQAGVTITVTGNVIMSAVWTPVGSSGGGGNGTGNATVVPPGNETNVTPPEPPSPPAPPSPPDGGDETDPGYEGEVAWLVILSIIAIAIATFIVRRKDENDKENDYLKKHSIK
ncbi:MAG: BspA family leucine-rich repeat surface protein [Methanosarcinales archaeon]|jgi:uncharacterized repeat protein (TIGR02543 family)|nr:BspA family leucine-rich repeat surface protein [Methanosarcinales archaeon]